jgi:hypothetical protein
MGMWLNAAASATSIDTPIQPDVALNPADNLNRLMMPSKIE